MDIEAIRGRLNKLQNSQRKSDLLWKPKVGTTQLRIVPYKFDKDNPFIELYFHYNINNKTYLSPQSFGRPDPIVEFADKLKRMGDKEDWKAAKAMEPKLRTFVPVLVRGEEHKGVKFWGFGKTVYQELLGYIADPDYGDITDPTTGRDITVEYTSAEAAGTTYPVTKIRIKPNTSLLSEDIEQAKGFIANQTEITELYSELSYDELKGVLNSWLNPDAKEEDVKSESASTLNTTAKTTTTESKTESTTSSTPAEPKEKEAPAKPKSTLDDVSAAFDDLFAK